jgi:hypothetical protein
MILESDKLAAFILGVLIALFFKVKKIKCYEIKEVNKLK